MQQMWQIKELIAFAMLTICVYTDLKERMIYITPLIICTSGAVIISAVSIFAARGSVVEAVRDHLVFPAVAGIVLIAFSYAQRDRIGIGDGCLLAALGMIMGNRYNSFIIVYSLMLAFLFSIILVIIGKKRVCRGIPFAPFVMTGFLFVLISEI